MELTLSGMKFRRTADCRTQNVWVGIDKSREGNKEISLKFYIFLGIRTF